MEVTTIKKEIEYKICITDDQPYEDLKTRKGTPVYSIYLKGDGEGRNGIAYFFKKEEALGFIDKLTEDGSKYQKKFFVRVVYIDQFKE